MSNDDLLALAEQCGGMYLGNKEKNDGVLQFWPADLATFAARLRAAPAQGAGGQCPYCLMSFGHMASCPVLREQTAHIVVYPTAQPAGQPEPQHCNLCGGTGGHWEGCKSPNMPAEQAQGVSDATEAIRQLRVLCEKGQYENAGSLSVCDVRKIIDKVRSNSPAPAPKDVPEFLPDVITDAEQAALYSFTRGTQHHNVVRKLYRSSPATPPTSPPVPQVQEPIEVERFSGEVNTSSSVKIPAPMSHQEIGKIVSRVAREMNRSTSVQSWRAVVEALDARDAQWLAALGRQA